MFDRIMYKFFGAIDTFFDKIDQFFTRKNKNENKRKH
jgi:hypothetical protein